MLRRIIYIPVKIPAYSTTTAKPVTTFATTTAAPGSGPVLPSYPIPLPAGQTVVEVLVVIDKELGDVFQGNYGKIVDYLSIYFWDINTRYKSLWSVDISFRFSEVLVIRVREFMITTTFGRNVTRIFLFSRQVINHSLRSRELPMVEQTMNALCLCSPSGAMKGDHKGCITTTWPCYWRIQKRNGAEDWLGVLEPAEWIQTVEWIMEQSCGKVDLLQ